MKNLEERVSKLIAEQLGVKPEHAVRSALLVEDLGADSLDVVEVTMAIEEEFELEIPDEAAAKMTKPEDYVNYVREHLPDSVDA